MALNGAFLKMDFLLNYIGMFHLTMLVCQSEQKDKHFENHQQKLSESDVINLFITLDLPSIYNNQ